MVKGTHTTPYQQELPVMVVEIQLNFVIICLEHLRIRESNRCKDYRLESYT